MTPPEAPSSASRSELHEASSAEEKHGGVSKPSRWSRSHAALVTLIVGFTVGYFFASLWRYQEFYGTNWDLGINMQILWSNTHGFILYDAGDYETFGVKSILSIHSAYIAIPISYLYAVVPSAATLFALQAAVVASSAIPLYLIGKRAGLPEVWLIAGLVVYLVSFTVTSALLYDFHWEAFIPAEFAWTFYLWTNRRYALALLPAALGVLTLEVFPFLLVGMVLYLGYSSVSSLLATPGPFIPKLRRNLRGASPLIGLLLFALASYVTIRIVQHDLISIIVGTPPLSLSSQASMGYTQLFSVNASYGSIAPSLVYWFLLFAAFGFGPLLVRQSLLLLSLPWFWASVFVEPGFSAGFGNQYAFVAVATISIAFVEGLARVYQSAQHSEAKSLLPIEWIVVTLPLFVLALLFSSQLLAPTSEGEALLAIVAGLLGSLLVLMWLSRGSRGSSSRSVRGSTQTIRSRDEPLSYPQSMRLDTREPTAPRPPRWAGLTRFQPKAGPFLGGVLIIVIASNVALSPFNTANFQATVFPGYWFSYSSNPAYSYVNDLVSKIPADATVLASDNLFPFVANDVNAYSLEWGTSRDIRYLPFNSTHLPPYALLSASQWPAVPNFLQDSIFNQSQFGIEAMVYCSGYPCSIYLFVAGYHGATTTIQATPFPNPILLCPSDLALGPSGTIVPKSGTACGSEIESIPAANLSGNGHTIWYGPYITLLPGLYNVTMSLRGGVYAGKTATAEIVFLDGGGFGLPSYWYAFNLNATTLKVDQWTNVTVFLNLTHPVSGVEFRGYLDYSGGSTPSSAVGFVDLNFIQIVRYSLPS